MNIVQVSASDGGGGAHKIGRALQRGLKARGHGSTMLVGRKTLPGRDVHEIPHGLSQGKRLAYRAIGRALRPIARRTIGLGPFRRVMRAPDPLAYFRAQRQGREFFDYPGSRDLLGLAPFPVDLVHLHNLHNEYFDLRSLPTLSAAVPVAMTLHDEWTFTGHCAYALGHEKWRDGCVGCPNLWVYPSLQRDGAHENWRAKAEIYEGSRLYVSAPSEWLLDHARASILAEGAVDFRLIRNGVDQEVFRPADQAAARELLGLPPDHLILLFAANALQGNPFKDHETVIAAAEQVATTMSDRRLLLIALGSEEPVRQFGNAELRFLPYETTPERVAAYYQAADVYLHAAVADTFPTTILEAMAVGRPVVATAVGGIPEQVRSLAGVAGAWAGASEGPETATGVLVKAQDASGMAAAATALLGDDGLRERLGQTAAATAAKLYGLDGQLDATLAWYAESIADWQRWRDAAA